MGTPSQVEEAANLAEELHGRIFNSDPQEVQEEPEVEEEQEVEQETPPETEEDLEDLKKYKDRYLSLKGKYDAEVPRLHGELKDFKAQVFEKLSTFSQKPQEEQESKPKENERLSKFREEYGDDFVETLKELMLSELSPKINESVKTVQQQVESVEDTQIRAAQQNFVGYLDQAVQGDWKSLWSGNDPKFMDFLSKPDPSGLYTYGELVQMYNEKWDADKLTKVFNTYFEDSAPKQKQPNPAKEAMVAPSRSTTHTTPASSDKRIWSQESMKQFQTEDRQGKYTPEESLALWEDLMKAPSENRMR